jgi:hypothetical protein
VATMTIPVWHVESSHMPVQLRSYLGAAWPSGPYSAFLVQQIQLLICPNLYLIATLIVLRCAQPLHWRMLSYLHISQENAY